MKAYKVTRKTYDGRKLVGKEGLEIFAMREHAQKYIDKYVEKRGGVKNLINSLGGDEVSELVIDRIDDYYIDED